MGHFLAIFVIALVGLQVPMLVQGKIDCRKVVFHPSCRGISAKRSNLQLEDSANMIDISDFGKRRQLVDSTNYSELEREDTPDIDISDHRRRMVPQAPTPPSRFPPAEEKSRPPVFSNDKPDLFRTPSTPMPPTSSSVMPTARRNTAWNSGAPEIIPPRHSSFFMGVRRQPAPRPNFSSYQPFKPRPVKDSLFPFQMRGQWPSKRRSLEQ